MQGYCYNKAALPCSPYRQGKEGEGLWVTHDWHVTAATYHTQMLPKYTPFLSTPQWKQTNKQNLDLLIEPMPESFP